jgi:hypothetical protein
MRAVPIALFASVGLLAAAPTAMAAPTECTGTLPPGTYEAIVVPEGQECSVAGSNVLGDVIALERASVQLADTEVSGSVRVGEEASGRAEGTTRVSRDLTMRAAPRRSERRGLIVP